MIVALSIVKAQTSKQKQNNYACKCEAKRGIKCEIFCVHKAKVFKGCLLMCLCRGELCLYKAYIKHIYVYYILHIYMYNTAYICYI